MDHSMSVTTGTMAYDENTTSFEKCTMDMMKYTMRFEKRTMSKIEEKDKVSNYDMNKLQPMGFIKCALTVVATK